MEDAPSKYFVDSELANAVTEPDDLASIWLSKTNRRVPLKRQALQDLPEKTRYPDDIRKLVAQQ